MTAVVVDLADFRRRKQRQPKPSVTPRRSIGQIGLTGWIYGSGKVAHRIEEWQWSFPSTVDPLFKISQCGNSGIRARTLGCGGT
jgi:hypothetical protein